MEQQAAQAALEYIRDGMTIGLGSGKVIEYLIQFISMNNYPHLKIVTNSLTTALEASKRELNVVPCEIVEHIDVAFEAVDALFKDGAIKTDSGVLVEDKLIAAMADKFIVIVDKENLVENLTDAYPVKVSVIPAAVSFVKYRLEEMKARQVVLPEDSHAVQSAGGNYVITATFRPVEDLKKLEEAIVSIPGVISTSLYTDLYSTMLVYSADGVETLENNAEEDSTPENIESK